MAKHVFIVTWFYPTQPGFLDFSYRIRALAERFDTTIVARAPILHEELKVEGVKHLVVPTAKTTVPALLMYQWKVAKIIRARRPDAVVLLGSQVSAIPLLVFGVPTYVYWNEHPTHVVGTYPRNPLKKAFARGVLELLYLGAKSATSVMPIGEAHRDELLERRADPRKVAMIYMGVHPMFHALSQGQPTCPEGKLRLIYTGSVRRERGRDVMLEGLAEANRNGRIANLTLVGATPDQLEYCNRRAVELGIVGDLFVHGRVPGHEIPSFLLQSDIGICLWEDRPYWRFNPPTKLFEYLVAGLPVLASNIRTHTQYVSDWRNGLIFEYDSASFADAIVKLWQRCAELPELKQKALKSGEVYLWDRIEPSFIQAIDALK